MSRNNDLVKYMEEYRSERINLKKDNLGDIKQKLKPQLCEKLNFLIKDQQRKKRDDSGKAEVFYLCRLLSSECTESYESILGISNASLFLDRNKSQTFWCAKHIYKDMDHDMKEVEKRLRKKFVRIEEYELLHLKRQLLLDDWEVLKDCFHELLQEHFPLLIDSSLDFEPEIKVMCGNYMEQLQLKSSYSLRRLTENDLFTNV